MKPIKLLLLLGAVWGQGHAQTAPAEQPTLPGEGSARTELDLSRRQTFAAKQGVQVSADGARLAPGPATGTFTSQPVAVTLAHPRPFLAVHVTWAGQNILAENLRPALRHSADGIAWSAWAPQHFDGHAGDAAARTTTQQYLDASTRFVQVQAELGATGPRATLRSVAVSFYSPGESLASPQPEHQERAEGPVASLAAAVCPKPAVVSRASWGARAPRSINDPSPITHLVVHHEEGPNSAANGDWAARVRAVQNLHMTTNGWADIGYAFLVDPNGVVYEGRAGGEDAQGAHWCGGNRNAMGVCMLGSYVTASPTAAAKESLAKLLAWKASKNGINPLGKSTHYQAGFVNNVCGHRDNNGCSNCPGNQLYSELGTIRARINTLVNSCSGTPPPPTPTTDTQAPTTSIGAPSTTVGADFTATFADADNVGVAERYYQVLESADGAEWRANRGNGFFNDNFNAAPLSAEWTTPTGTWAVNADQRLQQTNAALTNTNAATAVIQGSGQAYFYNFAAKLNSTAGARRFGLHLFASDLAGQERGNSYLVWFTADDQRVRLIETSAGNTLTERASAAWPTTSGTWADYKVTYNSRTGALAVFVNEARALSWTAPTPLASGAGISLRTNGADVEFDNVKVYKSRAATALVTVGPASSKDLRRNSANATTPAGKLKSLVRDAAGNWSPAGNLDLVVNLPATRPLAAGASDYAVYPNPTKGQLRFALPANCNPATLLLEVRNGRGVVLRSVGYSPNGLLDVSELPQGTYLLTVKDGKEIVSRQRFEKE